MKTFYATIDDAKSIMEAAAIAAATNVSPSDAARLAEEMQTPEREGTQTKPNEKKNPLRRLQFNPKTRVYLVPTLDEYTDEEIDNIWITEEEDIASQRDLIKTIEILRRNNGAIPRNLQDIYTARGIGVANQKEAAQRKALKMSHIDAVLDAQDDFCSPKEIAKISEAMSKAARKRAQFLGASDEEEIA